MALTQRHTYQVLTKRVKRMRDWLNDPATPEIVQAEMELIEPSTKLPGWPLDNVWCGTSVEDQRRADQRIPVLLQVKAAVRFLSIEPLLKPVSLFQAVGFKGASRLDWVIVGGESGRKARPMHPDWARNLRDECLTADIPFFFKQIGQWTWEEPARKRRTTGLLFDGRRVAAGTLGSVTMWDVGKKAAGNQLDGQIWEQMPRCRMPPMPKKAAKRRKTTRKTRAGGKRSPQSPKPDAQLDLF
jgi:protein gp37